MLPGARERRLQPTPAIRVLYTLSSIPVRPPTLEPDGDLMSYLA